MYHVYASMDIARCLVELDELVELFEVRGMESTRSVIACGLFHHRAADRTETPMEILGIYSLTLALLATAVTTFRLVELGNFVPVFSRPWKLDHAWFELSHTHRIHRRPSSWKICDTGSWSLQLQL